MRISNSRVITSLAGLLLLALPAWPVDGNYSMEILQVESSRGRVLERVRHGTGSMTVAASRDVQFNGQSGVMVSEGFGRFLVSNPLGVEDAAIRVLTSEGNEVLVGSSAGAQGIDNLFVAVRQPASPPVLAGEVVFHGGFFRMMPGVAPLAESRFLTLGAAANAITLGPDGRGTATVAGIGELRVALSANGNFLIGAPTAGQPGILFAVRKTDTPPAGMFFTVSLSVMRDSMRSGLGSLVVSDTGEARFSQQEHSPDGPSDLRGAAAVTAWQDGRALLAGQPVGGGMGNSMSLAGENDGVAWLMAAIPVPQPIDSGGVFLHPHGVVDAASMAPVGNPLAPNGLVSLFGLRLSEEIQVAETIPLPTSLAGVKVDVNGKPAGLLLVSPGQINLHLPPDVAGDEAVFQVTQPLGTSEPVRVRLAPTSPAIFSVSQGGLGSAVVTHADFELVSAASPARGGEVVIVFLTGLGQQQPPPAVFLNGQVAELQYAGPHSVFVGLYQMNIKLPVFLAADAQTVLTLRNRDGWSDTVTLATTP